MAKSDSIRPRRERKTVPHDYFIRRNIGLRFSRQDLFETVMTTPQGQYWDTIDVLTARRLAGEECHVLDIVEAYDGIPPKHYLGSAGLVDCRTGTGHLVATSMNDYLRALGIPLRGDLLPRARASAA